MNFGNSKSNRNHKSYSTKRDDTVIIPPKLSKGDAVGVIAPAGWTEEEKLQPAIVYLESKGFSVRLGDSVFTKTRYLAGADSARVRDINTMFADTEVKAIFCARGGYGSSRLLDQLDYTLIRKNPKVFIGFSDTTALQFGIFAQTGLVNYTGMVLYPDITELGMSSTIEKSLWALVSTGKFKPIRGLKVLKQGSINGPLLGGCLSLICSLVGTPYFPSLDGAILFIEDVNEEPYRLDRMLTQLRIAGVLERIGGLIFGHFVGCESEKTQYGSVEPVIAEFSEFVFGPVLAGLPYGHSPNRVVLPIGVEAHIASDSQGVLSIATHEDIYHKCRGC